MRVILQDEERQDGEIVLDEIYVQLVGKKDDVISVSDTTLIDLIKKTTKEM